MFNTIPPISQTKLENETIGSSKTLKKYIKPQCKTLEVIKLNNGNSERTIKWSKATELYKNKKSAEATPWSTAIKEYNKAQEQKTITMNRISSYLRVKKDSNINKLIDEVFTAFESGKVSGFLCFGWVEDLNNVNDNVERARYTINKIKEDCKKESVEKFLKEAEKIREFLVKLACKRA